jgi:hypothetical protein
LPDEDLPPEVTIKPEFQWIWRAWRRLSADRPFIAGGMGPSVPGAIPWAVAIEWARYHGLSRDEFDLMDHCLGRLDETYRQWWMERAAQQRESEERKWRAARR